MNCDAVTAHIRTFASVNLSHVFMKKNNILFAFRLEISPGSMFGNISTLNKFNLSSNDGENCHHFWFACANKMIPQRKWP